MTETFATGLDFPECPRWHQGQLHVSDMWARRVLRFDPDGTSETVVRLEDEPGGLGWLPSGDLLVVGMTGRKLWRLPAALADAGGAVQGDLDEYADLSALSPFELNDMWVGSDGTAWVTQFGSDWMNGVIEPCALIRVTPDGQVSPAAEGMLIPNGIVVDGSSLVVAEPGGGRLSVFEVDGTSLSNRVEVPLTPAQGAPYVAPDGVCIDDREGGDGYWVADPMAHRVFRIADGQTVQEVSVPEVHPTAVVVAEGRLWITAAGHVVKPDDPVEPTGVILSASL